MASFAAVDDAAAALRDALGAPPPEGIVRTLPPSELQRLADLVAGAREGQRQALREATASALEHVPFPLRIAVKKVLR